MYLRIDSIRHRLDLTGLTLLVTIWRQLKPLLALARHYEARSGSEAPEAVQCAVPYMSMD